MKPGGNDNKGQVVVTHYGVEGRICSRDWDDADAHVMCRSMNYQNGMAYYHDELATISSLRGPYWLSGFNCTGDEASLLECPNNTRLNLGNCSSSHIASVLCFNDTGESGEFFFFFLFQVDWDIYVSVFFKWFYITGIAKNVNVYCYNE